MASVKKNFRKAELCQVHGKKLITKYLQYFNLKAFEEKKKYEEKIQM